MALLIPRSSKTLNANVIAFKVMAGNLMSQCSVIYTVILRTIARRKREVRPIIKPIIHIFWIKKVGSTMGNEKTQ